MENISFTKDKYSFQQASDEMSKFEQILDKSGIKIKNGSELERIGLNIYDVLYEHKFPSSQVLNRDIRHWLREVLGMNHLIQRIIKVEKHPAFDEIIAHLKLLNDCTPVQSIPTSVTDQKSNKVFELLIACSIMQFTNNVQLDDPQSSKGDNPDILADINNKKWGFACKVAHSMKGKTLFDNILKGLNQIENSNADTGVVIINLKNIIEHDSYWEILNENEWKNGAQPEFSCFRDYKDAAENLIKEFKNIEKLIQKEVGNDAIIDAFKGKKSIPGVIWYVHTAIGTIIDSLPIPTTIGFLVFGLSVNNLSKNEEEVLNKLNFGLKLN